MSVLFCGKVEVLAEELFSPWDCVCSGLSADGGETGGGAFLIDASVSFHSRSGSVGEARRAEPAAARAEDKRRTSAEKHPALLREDRERSTRQLCVRKFYPLCWL